MTLQSYTLTIGALIDENNSGKNYVSDQPVYIKTKAGVLAPIFRDIDGASEIFQDGLSNKTDSRGQFIFFVEQGDYIAEYQSQQTPISVFGADYFNSRIDESVAQITADVALSRGYNRKGTFASGFTYELANDVGIDASGDAWVYTDIDALPVVVSAGTVPNEPEYTLVVIGNFEYQLSEHNSDPSAHPELSAFITSEADRAELAADAALVNSTVYTDEATGRAAVADAEYFKVIGSGDVAAYEYQRINASTSNLITSYPNADYVYSIANPFPNFISSTVSLDQPTITALKLIRSLRVLNINDAATWHLKGFGFSGSSIFFILKKSTATGDYINQTVGYDSGIDEWRLFEFTATDGEVVKITYNPSLAASLINNKVYYLSESVYDDSDYIETREVVSENKELISNTKKLSMGTYVDNELIGSDNIPTAQLFLDSIKYMRIDNRFNNQGYRLKGFGISAGTLYIILTVDGIGGDYFNFSSASLIDETDTSIKDFQFTMQNGEILTVGLIQSEIPTLVNNKVIPLDESVYFDNVTRSNQYADTAIANVNNRIDEISGSNGFLHISFDDFEDNLLDLIDNELTYTSLFDNSFFSTLKTLNDTYGAVFSMYCFNENTTSGFDISNVTNKFRQDFIDNSDWLKFGWHGQNSTVHLNSMTFADIQTQYNKFIDAISFFAGGSLSLDSVPRLSNFIGGEAEIQELLLVNGNIRGLLGSDNDATWSYYLGSVGSNALRKRNVYYDSVNQLKFFNSHKRLESMGSVSELDAELLAASTASNMKELVMFTHEGNSGGMTKLTDLCEWGAENGYSFDYPQNNL